MNTSSVTIIIASSRASASAKFEILGTEKSIMRRAIKEMRKGLKDSGLKGLRETDTFADLQECHRLFVEARGRA